jgi:hypothetical protein
MRALAVLLAALTHLLAAPALAAASPAPAPPRIEAGRSVLGRPIVAVRRGAADAPVRVLVVGTIHGNEPAGHAVVRALRTAPVPAGVAVWTVRSANPDGVARGTRQNARGVDLNRSFPYRWRAAGRPFDTFYPGGRAGSEPETRAVMGLVRRLRPAITIWYHQALRAVDVPPGVDPALPREYARLVGLPARRLPRYRGTATSWQNHVFPGATAFVVELPAGPLSAAAARRHARAVLALAAPRPAATATPAATSTATAAAPRPPIVWKRIPYGPDRRAQMRRYARRHYGIDSARLRDPKVIVEHVTATSSFSPAWNTFASNARDPELHERPGTCAHFIVDADGTIVQLVPLRLMCRHTVGLNYTAIGIEHVGLRDGDLMGRRRQLEASLALTRWLQGRFGIRTRDVIGHAESLGSPYHHERVKALRTQTHGDMAAPAMRRYRRLIGGSAATRTAPAPSPSAAGSP